jgi:hypothetical protein
MHNFTGSNSVVDVNIRACFDLKRFHQFTSLVELRLYRDEILIREFTNFAVNPKRRAMEPMLWSLST